MTGKPATNRTQAFDLHDAAYDVLSGAVTLRALACDLAQHDDGEPLRALDRDRMIFVINMIGEKAGACAGSWIDDHELRNGVEREAA
jgi:hypothetical protein